MLSSKIENIALSGTMEIAAKTIEMQEKGIDVIDLCVGESDLNTPDHIKEAAHKAISENKTRYTTNKGIIELRTAICKKFSNEYGAEYNPNEIIVSNGAKQALYNSLQVIIEDDDEVILPMPYYVSYPHMIRLAGGIPIFAKTEAINSFKITADELKAAMTPKTKAILLCNPNNPTGSVYTFDELKAILDIAIENNIYVLSDEIYENLIYNSAKFHSVCSFGSEYKNNLIIVNGVSKAYAMTGWRLGWAVTTEEIIQGYE